MNWWVIILGSMSALGLVMFIDLRVRSVEARNQMAERSLLSAQEFYVAIQDQMRQMQRYRHDLAKHIQMLEALREADQETLRDYNRKLREEYERQQERGSRYCRHEVVNMLLLLKEQQCRNLEIPFEAAVSAASLDAVGNLDWVGLLCNLLDNAIEASQNIPPDRPRGVGLRLEDGEDGMILTVENRIQPGERPGFSTRKDRQFHGFGLEIIDEILKRNQGKRTVELDREAWVLRTCCSLGRSGTDG